MKKLQLIVMISFIMIHFAMISHSHGQPTCSSYLQHYWKLEENNPVILYDSAGTLNATSIVAPVRITGKVGFGQSFDGLAEVNIPDDNSFDWDANSSFTIEFWMNKASTCPTPTAANNNVIIGRDDASTQLHWWVGVSCSNPGRINFNLTATNGLGVNLVSNTSVIDTDWHHIVVVRDGSSSTTSIYIDGILDASTNFIYTAGFSSGEPVNVGWLNLSTEFHYTGNLDELAVYDRAITPAEISDHFNSGNGKSYCKQGNVQNQEPVKIVLLGNSITYDNYSGDIRPVGQRIGYRLELFNKLAFAGYTFDFVGSETAGQDLIPDPHNAGFPGITKEQMVTLLETGFNPTTSTQEVNGPYLDFYQPDVILLHIGTNDLTTNITAINQILDIIDDYRLQSGKVVKLLIAKIINRQTYHASTTTYNTNLENAVLLRNNSDNVIVDMENGAGINYSIDMTDNLHPNNNGYIKMATLWFNTLATVLDPPPVPSTPGTPSALITQAPSSESVQLNWNDNSSNENGFRIERKTGAGSFSQIIQLGANVESYIDDGLTESTTYTYRVYAYNDEGNSGFSNESAVQTPSASGVVNLAPGKPSVQSATAYGGVASRANDNNTDGNWANGSVSNTGNQTSPYWQVDLQASYNLTDIEVWNRTNACCIARMANFYVFVSDNPFTSADPIATVNQSGVWNNFSAAYPNPATTIATNRTGRYVRVQLANEGELTIAEVRVFGSSGPPPPPTVPDDPTGLTTQATSSINVQLNWNDNSSNENGFRIERKTGAGSFSQIIQLGANVESWLDGGLTASTTYTYRVYAFNDEGNSGFSNESVVQTLPESGVINLAPGKPSVQSATAFGGIASRANDNNTNGNWANGSVSNTGNQLSPYWQIDLQANYNITDIEVWNRTDACCIARMANFYVFVSDNPFTSADPIATVNQSGVWNSFSTGYPNPSTTIAANRTGRYVRVQLANLGELTIAEVRVFGSSGPPPPPTVPDDPTGLTTQATSSVNVQLNWNDNSSNENGFRVERKTGAGSFSQIIQLGANVESYLDDGLTESTTYTYRVYAFNDEGNSSFSNESVVQTLPESGVVNLAPGKPSDQSTTAYGGVASRANDNNTDGNWANGSVSNTGNQPSPYWQVDLQASYDITDIEVWNRTNACCISRMANFYVFVSDNPFTSADPIATVNQSGVWNSFNAAYPNPSVTIAVNRTGRYVRVQLANLGELSIAEVRIFGSSLKKAFDLQGISEEIQSLGLSVFPNPADRELNIHFQIDEETKGFLGVFDMTGRLLSVLANGQFHKGNHAYIWNRTTTDKLPAEPGFYLIKLVAGQKTEIKKIIITK